MERSSGARSAASVVGANVGRARSRAGLSLSELAVRSGVGKATLSRVEAGAANPRLETLWALATTLGVGLGELVAAPEAALAVTRRADAPTLAGAAVLARLLDRAATPAGALEVYDLEIAPVRQHSQAHARGTVERLAVVAGRLRAGPRAAPVELGPGDHLRFAGDAPHTYEALADTARAVLVVTYER